MPMPSPNAADLAAAAEWLAGRNVAAFYRLPFTVRRAVQQARQNGSAK